MKTKAKVVHKLMLCELCSQDFISRTVLWVGKYSDQFSLSYLQSEVILPVSTMAGLRFFILQAKCQHTELKMKLMYILR